MAARTLFVRLATAKSSNFVQRSNLIARVSTTSGEGDSFSNEKELTAPLPPSKEYQNETPELTRARLLYQSRKRGMLENGLLLGCFADQYLDKLNETQLSLYDKLINEPTNDWDIYYWITGARPTPEYFDHEVMNMLKDFVKNEDCNSRIVQPDL